MAKLNKLMIIGIGLLLASQGFAESKKYIVTVKSPQTYEMLSASAKGFQTFGAFNNDKNFSFLSSSPDKIVEAFDNLDMVVIESDDPQEIEMLKASGIVDIEEEMILPEPTPIGNFQEASNNSVSIAPLQRPWGIDAVKAPEAWAASNYGDGARVLVLDTGIDRDHPAFVGNFEKGRNFMKRTDNPVYEYLDVNGHGTHVSGTIAGNGLNGAIVGVAPKAKLLMGRVCGGGCSTIAIIAGVDWGIDEKVDVMNLSLGGPFPSQAASQAYKRAEAANIVVVAASGNGGNNKVSFPAAFDETYSVGAVDSTLTKADFSQWGPELDIVAPGVNTMSSVPRGTGRSANMTISIEGNLLIKETLPMQGSGMGVVTAEVVAAGLGRPADVQNLDLTGKIALIQRGEISFADKAINAIQQGAIAVAIFNNVDGPLAGTMGDKTVNSPVVGLSKIDGEDIVSALSNKSAVEGTLAVEASDYAELQGTSMASPHVAGVAALVRAANMNLTAAEARSVMSTTATNLKGDNSANQLGNGLINAEAAVNKAAGAVQSFLLTGTD